MMRKIVIAVVLLMLFVATADAQSKSAKYRFQKANPYPVNAKHFGKFPGHVIDHIEPLYAGGADHPRNMQWQTIRDAKIKDREEGRQCRKLRTLNRPD